MGNLRSSRNTVACPPLWRLCGLQCVAWLLALILVALFANPWLAAVFWSGLIAMGAQAYWVRYSLRDFGDARGNRYLAGAVAGQVGKWVIILVGLVLLWRSQPDVSVAATVITVFGLNTLAAIAAPILISQPR